MGVGNRVYRINCIVDRLRRNSQKNAFIIEINHHLSVFDLIITNYNASSIGPGRGGASFTSDGTALYNNRKTQSSSDRTLINAFRKINTSTLFNYILFPEIKAVLRIRIRWFARFWLPGSGSKG